MIGIKVKMISEEFLHTLKLKIVGINQPCDKQAACKMIDDAMAGRVEARIFLLENDHLRAKLEEIHALTGTRICANGDFIGKSVSPEFVRQIHKISGEK